LLLSSRAEWLTLCKASRIVPIEIRADRDNQERSQTCGVFSVDQHLATPVYPIRSLYTISITQVSDRGRCANLLFAVLSKTFRAPHEPVRRPPKHKHIHTTCRRTYHISSKLYSHSVAVSSHLNRLPPSIDHSWILASEILGMEKLGHAC
jgi:hypothetical protein